MLRLIIDQDFDHDILRGLLRRTPSVDVVTALQEGLSEATDTELLEAAHQRQRVIVTHDRKTMPAHAARRMKDGKQMSGVFVVPRQLPILRVIEDLEIIVMCSEDRDWENVVRYLPL